MELTFVGTLRTGEITSTVDTNVNGWKPWLTYYNYPLESLVYRYGAPRYDSVHYYGVQWEIQISRHLFHRARHLSAAAERGRKVKIKYLI